MSRNLTLSPQCADILAHLRKGPLTTLQLRQATGVLALGTRIHELRIVLEPTGMQIDTRLITVRNRHRQRVHVAEYTLRRAPRSKGRSTPARKRAEVRN